MTHSKFNSVIARLSFLQVALCCHTEKESSPGEMELYGLYCILEDMIELLKAHEHEFVD